MSSHVCVTPRCLRGHPRPCFSAQGSAHILRALQAGISQGPLGPALWVCGQQDSHCATAAHFPKKPQPLTLVLINCQGYTGKSNLGAVSQGKWDQALCSLSSSPELTSIIVCNCTTRGKGDSFPADPHPLKGGLGAPHLCVRSGPGHWGAMLLSSRHIWRIISHSMFLL